MHISEDRLRSAAFAVIIRGLDWKRPETPKWSALESGYRQHFNVDVDGENVCVGTRPGRLRWEVGEDHAVEVDPEGRLTRREKNGESWRTTMDWRILRSRRDSRALRRLPTRDHAWEELAQESAYAERIAAILSRSGIPPSVNEGAVIWLARAGRFTVERLKQDRARLQEIYRPIPVLPPDQYSSLVVQLTEGCPWDRCSFCNFYRGVKHRVRNDVEFETHFESLLSHLGRSVERCSRVFLGQANALLAPAELLRSRLEYIGDRLGLVPNSVEPHRRRAWRRDHPTSVDGFYSFVDAFHQIPNPTDLESYRERGLRRVYLGLETGSDAVLDLLQKPSRPEGVQQLADHLHRAELSLAVILLVGAGGRSMRDEHLKATVKQIEGLGLRKSDQVYLSRLVVHDGSEYVTRAQTEGIEALDPAELRTARADFHRVLRKVLPPGVVVANYDLEQISMWTPRA